MSIGRNDPCHCGSGKKYKRCCLPNDTPLRVLPTADEDESAFGAAAGLTLGSNNFVELIRRHPELRKRELELHDAIRTATGHFDVSELPTDDPEELSDILRDMLEDERFDPVRIRRQEMRDALQATGFNFEKPTMSRLKKVTRLVCTQEHREERAAALLGIVPGLVEDERYQDALLVGLCANEMLQAAGLPTVFEIQLLEDAIADLEYTDGIKKGLAGIADKLDARERVDIERMGVDAWLTQAIESPPTIHRLFDLLLGRHDADEVKRFLGDQIHDRWCELLERPDAADLLLDESDTAPYLAKVLGAGLQRMAHSLYQGITPRSEVGGEALNETLAETSMEMGKCIGNAKFAKELAGKLSRLRETYLKQRNHEAAACAEVVLLALDISKPDEDEFVPFAGLLCGRSLFFRLKEVTRSERRMQEFLIEQGVWGESPLQGEPEMEATPFLLDPEISDDAWARLYRAAMDVYGLAPSEWMPEEDLFAVRIEPTGEMGFVSAMDEGRRSQMITVFVGEQGGNRYRSTIHSKSVDEAADKIARIERLHLEFTAKAELEEVERRLIKRLGIKPKRGEWPCFRSWQPGYVLWGINAEECRLLTHALEQLLEVAPRLQQDAHMLRSDEPHTWLVRTVTEMPTGDSVSEGWERFEPVPEEIKPVLDIDLVRRATRLPVKSEVWEVDASILHSIIDDGEGRPRLPLGLLLADAESGFALGARPMVITRTMDDLRAEVPNELMRALIEIGKRPRAIALKTDWMIEVLSKLLPMLSIEMREEQELPALQMLKEALEAHSMG